MWSKSNPKITLEFKGLANFNNSCKKIIDLKIKQNIWKVLNKVQKAKVMMGKTSKKKWKNFKKTLKRMEKKNQWNTKTQLYGLLSKKGA